MKKPNSHLYNEGRSEIISGNLDWENDSVDVLLVSMEYKPNISHKISDIPPETILGTGNLLGKKIITKTKSIIPWRKITATDAQDITIECTKEGTIHWIILENKKGYLICYIEVPYSNAYEGAIINYMEKHIVWDKYIFTL